MNRREVFPILGGAATAFAAPPADYQPRALNPDEYALVTRLANLILPADSTSAGAGDAGVAYVIDTLLRYGPSPNRDEFRAGLALLAGLAGSALDSSLARLAVDESKPGAFFGRLKSMVVDAYCLTAEGRKYLKYTGDSAIEEFKGCDHPEHHRP